MADKDSELRVVRQNSDGRRRYDVCGLLTTPIRGWEWQACSMA